MEENETTKFKNYLQNKHPDLFIPLWMCRNELYTLEARKEFSKIVLKRFEKVKKYGHPKKCPIEKFLKQPTLF